MKDILIGKNETTAVELDPHFGICLAPCSPRRRPQPQDAARIATVFANAAQST